jgi:UDP-glucose 4-epimerase
MTVLGIARSDASGAARLADRPRRRGAVPATRELETTLRALLVLAASLIALGALVPITAVSAAAVALAVLLLASAAVVQRATRELSPSMPALRRRPVRAAVVGTAAAALELQAELEQADVGAVVVVGRIAPRPDHADDPLDLGPLPDLSRIVAEHAIDVLLVGSGVSRSCVAETVMRSCEGDPVRLCDLSAFYAELFGRVPVTELDGAWFQCVLHPRFHERRSQRVFDVFVATVLALLFLPLLGPLALIIRSDGGPALFRQRRIGRDGRPFDIYKLRTMGWERDGGNARWSSSDDPRVTRVGRILRRWHLDELPQLFNVLRGEMTLVGPRPEQPELAAQLEQTLPYWRGRYRHKPGITGWAQIRCGYAGSHDGAAWKLAHDLYYLRRRSLALDAAILLQTASTLLFAPQYVEAPEAPLVVRRRPRFASPPARISALVTGGAGFIGSHLVDALEDAGHDVAVVDDLSSGRRENLAGALSRGVRLEHADVTDVESLRECFAAIQPDVVFHLAAQIDVARAVTDPLHDEAVNVAGTLAALEAARASGARRFVLASSGGAIYGDASEIPTPEHASVAPLSPYGAGKAAAEEYTATYGRLYGLSALCLRLANVYGPRQGSSGEGGVIARFCHARLDGVYAPVFGDGLQTRDYVHVRDVVAAFMLAGASRATGALNIGTGTETTVLELIHSLGLQPDFRAPRRGEVQRSCLDATAADRVLGWHPQVTLAQGLADTVAFAARAAAPQPAAALPERRDAAA